MSNYDTLDIDDPSVSEKILSITNNNNVGTDSTVNIIGRLPIYLSHYFKVKEIKETSLIVECTQCICTKTLSTPLNSTGNLYKHLRRIHPSFQKPIKQIKDKSLSESNSQPNSNNIKKQKSLWTANIKNEEKNKKKEKANKLIEQFIVKKMLPISLVEDPYFIELIEGLSGVKPMSRRTFQNHLLAKMVSIKSDMIAVFEKQP